jgi:tRNA(fMet)-specific endonuclease VapC
MEVNMYLLDTDVIINHLHKKAPIHIPNHQQTGASIISYGEILFGIQASKNTKAKREEIEAFRNEVQLEIINLNDAIIEQYAITRFLLESKGQKLDDFDLLIAATAIHFGYPLVTRNKKHFLRIPELILADE